MAFVVVYDANVRYASTLPDLLIRVAQADRLMVPGTRISLDVLVAAFKRGKTPEAIHEGDERVSLADV